MISELHDTLHDQLKNELTRKMPSIEQVETLILALESRVSETAELLDIDAVAPESHMDILEKARAQMLQVGLGSVNERAAPERREAHVDRNNRRPLRENQTDSLTGLGDRTYLEVVLAQELRVRVYGDMPGQLGMLVLGPPDAQALRERHGDAVADEIVHALAQMLRTLSRNSDAPTRFENDLLAVAIPATTTEGLGFCGRREGIAAHAVVLLLPAGP